MDDNRLPKRILNYTPEGRRNIGRQQTTWEDYYPRHRRRGLSLIVDDDYVSIIKISDFYCIL